MWRIYTFRKEHPIKQRAPWIAICHLASRFIYVALLYILEWMTLESWNTKTVEEMPFSRKIVKGLIYSIRFNFSIIYVFRVVVIYCQWKCQAHSSKILKFCAKERRMCLVMLVWLIICWIYYIFAGGVSQLLNYESLNWYQAKDRFWYKILTLGGFQILESSLLAFTWYYIRDFPNSFGVKKEVRMVLLVTILRHTTMIALEPLGMAEFTTKCSKMHWFYFTPAFFYEYWQIFTLVAALYYYNKPKVMIPPTPSRMITNFKVFISNQVCVNAFVNFLEYKEDPILIKQFESMMLQMIENMTQSVSYASPDIPENLYDAFIEYQQTKSFRNLRKLLQGYEAVYYQRFALVD